MHHTQQPHSIFKKKKKRVKHKMQDQWNKNVSIQEYMGTIPESLSGPAVVVVRLLVAAAVVMMVLGWAAVWGGAAYPFSSPISRIYLPLLVFLSELAQEAERKITDMLTIAHLAECWFRSSSCIKSIVHSLVKLVLCQCTVLSVPLIWCSFHGKFYSQQVSV